MSAPDPTRLPEAQATRELTKAARRVERLKLRRRAALKRLAELDDEIRAAKRYLAAVAEAVTSSAPYSEPIDREAAELLIDRAHEGR